MVGDGAMQMNGMDELITIGKYWQRWSDPRLIVLVLHNDDLNQVTWEQRAMEGDPRYDASQDIPDFPYARYAELCGLQGIRVDDADEIGAAWDDALAADRPCRARGDHRPDRARRCLRTSPLSRPRTSPRQSWRGTPAGAG